MQKFSQKYPARIQLKPLEDYPYPLVLRLRIYPALGDIRMSGHVTTMLETLDIMTAYKPMEWPGGLLSKIFVLNIKTIIFYGN